jgi:hypothetical protein
VPNLDASALVSCGSPLAVKSELAYSSDMSSVHEIETAVSKLSRQELLAFRDWFSGFGASARDKQFEEDVAAGHLDALADEAIRDSREGRCATSCVARFNSQNLRGKAP